MAESIGKNHLHGKALSLWGCLIVRDDIGVPVDDLTDSLLLFVSVLPGNRQYMCFNCQKNNSDGLSMADSCYRYIQPEK